MNNYLTYITLTQAITANGTLQQGYSLKRLEEEFRQETQDQLRSLGYSGQIVLEKHADGELFFKGYLLRDNIAMVKTNQYNRKDFHFYALDAVRLPYQENP